MITTSCEEGQSVIKVLNFMNNPYQDQTTTRQHNGMWIVNIGKSATVIADKCKEKALERAIKQHDEFVRNFEEFL